MLVGADLQVWDTQSTLQLKGSGVFPLVLIRGFRKVPTALADHVEKNNLQGKLKYSLFVGASSGAETENRWARLDMIGIQSDRTASTDYST